MSLDKGEKGPPKIPVMTAEQPTAIPGLTILGIVVVSGAWDIPFPNAVEDLAVKLARRAVEQYPSAAILYNMKWRPGAGHYGHTWVDGTADAYAIETVEKRLPEILPGSRYCSFCDCRRQFTPGGRCATCGR